MDWYISFLSFFLRPRGFSSPIGDLVYSVILIFSFDLSRESFELFCSRNSLDNLTLRTLTPYVGSTPLIDWSNFFAFIGSSLVSFYLSRNSAMSFTTSLSGIESSELYYSLAGEFLDPLNCFIDARAWALLSFFLTPSMWSCTSL